MAGNTCCHVGWSYVAMCHYVKKAFFGAYVIRPYYRRIMADAQKRVCNDPEHASVMYLLYRLVIVPFKGGMHI